jgi:hypothetical protein
VTALISTRHGRLQQNVHWVTKASIRDHLPASCLEQLYCARSACLGMEVARVAIRGCGTCKGTYVNPEPRFLSDDLDRKILCDRRVPVCQQCARSKRSCNGYGLKLSWPKPGDGRRAMVVKQQRPRKTTEGPSYPTGIRLIHAYSRDVELYYHLTSSLPIRPTLRIPLPFNQSPLNAGDLDLLQYCTTHLPTT